MFSEFLIELKLKEIEIHVSEGKVIYSGPEQYIDDQLIERLMKYKGKLIRNFWPRECTNMMPINTEGSKSPFILLHGEKMNYPLSEHLGVDYPFYGFFHYGSQGEKIFHKKVEAFAKDYINQLQKIVPSGPYYLAGFSFGGLIAFEMAIQLQRLGFEVPVLILIDCKVPSLKEPLGSHRVLPDPLFRLYNYSKDIFYWTYHKWRSFYYEFILLFKTYLKMDKRNYYIMSTYMDIAKRYSPGAKFKGEILLFRSEQNRSVHKHLGWDSYCDSIKLVIIEGNHKTIYETVESYKVLSENIGVTLQISDDKLK
jgi:thioesterase domain-containing protein